MKRVLLLTSTVQYAKAAASEALALASHVAYIPA